MNLDRNINPDGKGKYALLNLRTGKLEHGEVGAPDEFFVIKLRDINALPALIAYAESAECYDAEYAAAIRELAARSGINSKFCKRPD